jgi:hypothetical protein
MKPYTKENLIAAHIDYDAFLRLLEKEVMDLQEQQKQRSELSLATKNPYDNGVVFLVMQLKKVMAIEVSTTNQKIARRLFYILAAYPENTNSSLSAY